MNSVCSRLARWLFPRVDKLKQGAHYEILIDYLLRYCWKFFYRCISANGYTYMEEFANSIHYLSYPLSDRRETG